MSLISSEDRDRIAQAIRTAETRTAGEIICVVMHAASDYRSVPLLWAALIALAVPWPLISLTTLSAHAIHMTQLAVFAGLAIFLSFSAWRFRLVPGLVKRRRARQAAREQFFAQGLYRTSGRSGLLIFVAEAERYAEILVDDGIAEKVDDHVWREAVTDLVEALKDGKAVDGILSAVNRCADILAEHVPPDAHNPDELSNKVVII